MTVWTKKTKIFATAVSRVPIDVIDLKRNRFPHPTGQIATTADVPFFQKYFLLSSHFERIKISMFLLSLQTFRFTDFADRRSSSFVEENRRANSTCSFLRLIHANNYTFKVGEENEKVYPVIFCGPDRSASTPQYALRDLNPHSTAIDRESYHWTKSAYKKAGLPYL